MPQTLSLSTPPSSLSSKRQRSQDSRHRLPRSDIPVEEGHRSRDVSATPAKTTSLRIPSYLNRSKIDITGLFQELEWKQRFRVAHGISNPDSSPYRIDRTMNNIARNRYANVQPWDQSRVKLKTPLGGSDYVNASPIHLNSNVNAFQLNQLVSASHADSAPLKTPNDIRYVASQGPKEGQALLFWHMVLQESVGDVGVVVMLTQMYEGHKEKCSQYFPWDMENPVLQIAIEKEPSLGGPTNDGDPFLDSPKQNSSADRNCTDLENAESEPPTSVDTVASPPQSGQAPDQSQKFATVTLIDISADRTIGSEVRHLRIEIEGQSKDVYHYLYVNWPDYGKPEAEDRQALLELTRQSRLKAGGSPRIIHCSAGVGRTGTFIALDFLLRELEEGRISPQPKPEIPTIKTPESNKTERWGNSGPTKDSTPSAIKDEDEDVIFQTVNQLREQRMMMVMNEIQLSFLYEVIRDCFMEKYCEKETGISVSSNAEIGPRKGTGNVIKRSRLQGPGEEMCEASKVGTVKGEDDTVSEAETEIEGDKTLDEQQTHDPYDVVAPDSIKRGIDKGIDDQETQGVEQHEVR